MNLSSSGAGVLRERATPIVLRLLPHVHHPPARLAMPWGAVEGEARALDARGYRVTVFDGSAPGPGIDSAPAPFSAVAPGTFDLVCETGGFGALGAEERIAYVQAAARALRPGGLLFGAFPGEEGAGALLTLFGAHFDAARLEPSALGGAGAWFEAVFVRR